MSARAVPCPRFLTDRDALIPRFRGVQAAALSRRERISTQPTNEERIVECADLNSARWLLPTIESIIRLFGLRENWDSSGARRVDTNILPTVINSLATFLPERAVAPSVVPTVNGGVQVEWHVSDMDLEVEFMPHGAAHALFEDLRDRSVWEGPVEENVLRLRQIGGRLEIPGESTG